MEIGEMSLKDLSHNYSKEVFTDLQQKLRDGEYQPGKVYRDQFPDDIADVLENLLFLQESEEVVIRVRKEIDEYHINFEVLSRK